MIRYAKITTHKLLRLILYPFRKLNNHSNGVYVPSQKIEIPNDVLLGSVKEAIKEGHTATIIVKGWSMRPFLEHLRDKVVLAPAENINRLDAVLAEIAPGKYVLHRIVNITKNPLDKELDEITLMGDGNVHGQEKCFRKDICGKVTHYIRPKQTISADSPNLMTDIVRWNRLLPIRRFLLFIYKALI